LKTQFSILFLLISIFCFGQEKSEALIFPYQALHVHGPSVVDNLTAAFSDDDGVTWKWKKNLENDLRGKKATSFHYPAVIEGENGKVHTVYSYHRRYSKPDKKTIKWMAFDLDWLRK
jgi:hypothetical protein